MTTQVPFKFLGPWKTQTHLISTNCPQVAQLNAQASQNSDESTIVSDNCSGVEGKDA